MGGGPSSEVTNRHLIHPGDLTIGRVQRRVGGDHIEDPPPHDRIGLPLTNPEPSQSRGVDIEPCLFGKFTDRGEVIRFTDPRNPTEGDIPQRRVDVLPVGSLMHHQPSVASLDEDGDVAMPQVLGAHLGPGDDPFDRPVGADHLNKLIRR